jgi:hypothetical protein
MRWARNLVRIREKNAYKVLVGRTEGKRQLGKRRRSWEENIKMDVREIR